MAGTPGDIVQLTLFQLNQSQQQLNVHFYRVEDEPTEGYLEGLCTQFEEAVLPLYAAVQSDAVNYYQLTARNIFVEDEFVLSPLTPSAGDDSTGEYLPSFVSANIKLVRGNARVRHGRKSVGGGSEGGLEDQEWTPAYLTALQALADGLAAPLTAGVTDTFAPVIVGRVLHDADPPDHPEPWYALPTSQAEMGLNWAYVISGLASPFVSTMNSRKLGRGS